MISESDIASSVRAYLEADGWTAYSEVSLDHRRRHTSPVGDGRADLVGTREGQIAVVECKSTLSFELIAQGKRWIPYTNMIWLAFPEAKRTVGRDAAFEIARGFGFGLFRVDDKQIRTFGSPKVRVHLESDALLVSRSTHRRPPTISRTGRSTSASSSRSGRASAVCWSAT
jgi:hypothetical protein